MIKEAIVSLVEKKDLSQDVINQAMKEIATGVATPAQAGAFLTALRMKEKNE